MARHSGCSHSKKWSSVLFHESARLWSFTHDLWWLLNPRCFASFLCRFSCDWSLHWSAFSIMVMQHGGKPYQGTKELVGPSTTFSDNVGVPLYEDHADNATTKGSTSVRDTRHRAGPTSALSDVMISPNTALHAPLPALFFPVAVGASS